MNSTPGATTGDGPNGPWIRRLMIAAHLAGNNALPRVYAWSLITGDRATDHEPVIEIHLGDNEADIAPWAAWLGAKVGRKPWHSVPGAEYLEVLGRYLGEWVRVWIITNPAIATPAAPEPAEMGLPPAPHPAEALGQAPAATPQTEPYETRQDGRIAPPAAAPPPGAEANGMYGSIR